MVAILSKVSILVKYNFWNAETAAENASNSLYKHNNYIDWQRNSYHSEKLKNSYENKEQ